MVFEGGLAQFSMRRKGRMEVQVYRDNRWLETDQDYQPGCEPILGLFADVETAEAELLRYPSFKAC